MKKLNETLGFLELEIEGVASDARAVALLLEACPNCRVKRANVVKGLHRTAERLLEVKGAVSALKDREEGEDEP